MGKIPDRWLNYTAIGEQIAGTNFISFKVPLNEQLNKLVNDNQKFGLKDLLKNAPNLGLIIDLTNTNRYYNPKDLIKNGIQYVKQMVPGHEIPDKRIRKSFTSSVRKYLKNNLKSNKLIGVHCTHGVNRTGFLICDFMINEMNMDPLEALQRFEKARGYKIERKNYTNFLTNKKCSSEKYIGKVEESECINDLKFDKALNSFSNREKSLPIYKKQRSNDILGEFTGEFSENTKMLTKKYGDFYDQRKIQKRQSHFQNQRNPQNKWRNESNVSKPKDNQPNIHNFGTKFRDSNISSQMQNLSDSLHSEKKNPIYRSSSRNQFHCRQNHTYDESIRHANDNFPLSWRYKRNEEINKFYGANDNTSLSWRHNRNEEINKSYGYNETDSEKFFANGSNCNQNNKSNYLNKMKQNYVRYSNNSNKKDILQYNDGEKRKRVIKFD